MEFFSPLKSGCRLYYKLILSVGLIQRGVDGHARDQSVAVAQALQEFAGVGRRKNRLEMSAVLFVDFKCRICVIKPVCFRSQIPHTAFNYITMPPPRQRSSSYRT